MCTCLMHKFIELVCYWIHPGVLNDLTVHLELLRVKWRKNKTDETKTKLSPRDEGWFRHQSWQYNNTLHKAGQVLWLSLEYQIFLHDPTKCSQTLWGKVCGRKCILCNKRKEGRSLCDEAYGKLSGNYKVVRLIHQINENRLYMNSRGISLKENVIDKKVTKIQNQIKCNKTPLSFPLSNKCQLMK